MHAEIVTTSARSARAYFGSHVMKTCNMPLDGTYNCCITCWQLNYTTRTSCATCALVARPEPNILTCKDVGMWQNLLYILLVGGWKVVQQVVELLVRVRWWCCTTCCTTCSCSGVWPLYGKSVFSLCGTLTAGCCCSMRKSIEMRAFPQHNQQVPQKTVYCILNAYSLYWLYCQTASVTYSVTYRDSTLCWNLKWHKSS
jgi:hypothetical protein